MSTKIGTDSFVRSSKESLAICTFKVLSQNKLELVYLVYLFAPKHNRDHPQAISHGTYEQPGGNRTILNSFLQFHVEYFDLQKPTFIRNSCKFCSANRRAIHDLGPCPKGRTKYGCICSLPAARSHRSGINSFGFVKYSGSRQDT